MYKTIKLVAAVLLIAALSASTEAKTRHFGNNSANTNTRPQGLLSGVDAKRLSPAETEAKFRPFLEERVRERRGGAFGNVRSARAARPSQRDLFILMKAWDNLTPEFRALYSEAAANTSDYDYNFTSPGGKFKIYYMKTGRDKVDVNDNIGYGVNGQPSAWRVRNSSSNGVPDYIDEAAFALDSAWEMEVERFGFPNPLAAGGSGYYPVYVKLMDDYGMTYPNGRFTDTNAGFFSYIEINSDWSDWGDLGYDKRPYDAIRVTCAHEFFHAIQYAMARTTENPYYEIDDFPLGWLEGSAVLMEELAYPDINDYFQYISDFFKNPRISFLSDNYEYLNSILFKYLYEKTNPSDSIGFIKTVHANNYINATPFYGNIEKVSANHAGKSWAEVLNGFHAESYFTGMRARRPWAFVTDAGQMDSWAIPAASTSDTESKTAKPYAVEFFRYAPQDDAADTLILNISGQADPSVSGKTWGASVLVMEKNDSVGIAPVTMDNNGAGRFELTGWRGKRGCLLVATNASPDKARNVTITTTLGVPVSVAPNVVQLQSDKPVRILGGGITEVKIYSLDGKLVWSGKRPANGELEWPPEKYKRLTPGTYLMTAATLNLSNGKKGTHKRKIMILP